MDGFRNGCLDVQDPGTEPYFTWEKDSLVAFCSNASQIQWCFDNILPSLICQWSTGDRIDVSLIIY